EEFSARGTPAAAARARAAGGQQRERQRGRDEADGRSIAQSEVKHAGNIQLRSAPRRGGRRIDFIHHHITPPCAAHRHCSFSRSRSPRAPWPSPRATASSPPI